MWTQRNLRDRFLRKLKMLAVMLIALSTLTTEYFLLPISLERVPRLSESGSNKEEGISSDKVVGDTPPFVHLEKLHGLPHTLSPVKNLPLRCH